MPPLTLFYGSGQTEAAVSCQGVASLDWASASEKEWDLQAFLVRLPALEWDLLVTQQTGIPGYSGQGWEELRVWSFWEGTVGTDAAAFFLFFLATLSGMWTFSSPTRDQGLPRWC